MTRVTESAHAAASLPKNFYLSTVAAAAVAAPGTIAPGTSAAYFAIHGWSFTLDSARRVLGSFRSSRRTKSCASGDTCGGNRKSTRTIRRYVWKEGGRG